MKTNWKTKLTSRKMWLSIAEFVTMLYVALGGSESEATQIAALIMAGAGVIGYVIAEGLIDSKASTETPVIEVVEEVKVEEQK